jgi:hypothetical protein
MKYDYVVGRILDYFPELKPEGIVGRLRQSTFVDTGKRYMYSEVPKAACTQMKHALRQLVGAPPIELFSDPNILETRRDLYVHARSNVPLPSLVDLDNGIQKVVLESPDFLRMTIVRNPYTRLVSAWRNKVLLCDAITGRNVFLELRGRLPGIHEKQLISFDEFVRYIESKCDLLGCDLHWMRQVDYTFFPAMNFSFIGKVERLNESLRRLEQHIGLSESLVADGRNESLPVGSASYTEELADRVYSLYRADFDALGYDRETWAMPGPRGLNQEPGSSIISEERLRYEIIERNLVILGLYEERERLQRQLQRVSRLHLLPIVNRLAAIRSTLGRIAWGADGWERRRLRPHAVNGTTRR